jgi:zinc transporter
VSLATVMTQDLAKTLSGISDTEGLICAFELSPTKQRGLEVLAEDASGASMWMHFNLSDSRARRWLERADLPPAARELFLDSDTRIRVQIFPDGLVAVLGDLHHDFKGEPDEFGVLRVYVDARRMITARSHPLKSSDQLRRELRRGELQVDTPVALFEHYLTCLSETFSKVIAELADQTDDIEEEVLAGDFKSKGPSLGKMRRLFARLRRHINANRAALAPVPSRLPEIDAPERRQTLRQAIEPFEALAQDLDLVQERARLLQEEIAGRIGEATNRNLFVLSIVTTILLPITLITGIFGMNVGGLPWARDSGGFWWVMVVMIVAVVIVVQLLRRQRVL